MADVLKHCRRCGHDYPLSDFYIERSRRDGLSLYCKTCCKSRSREWELANPEKKRAKTWRWYSANKAKARASNARSRLKYGVKRIAYWRARRHRLKET